jgi:hypothetical protein
MKKTMLMVLFAAVLGVAAPALAATAADGCPLGCCSGSCCQK